MNPLRREVSASTVAQTASHAGDTLRSGRTRHRGLRGITVKTIELQFPDQLYHRAESLAASQRCSPDKLLASFAQRTIDEQAPPERP
jgi:hypothetical protein